MNVILVGTSDRQLEELLRPIGARVSTISTEELFSLSGVSSKTPDAIVIDVRQATEIPTSLSAVKRRHPDTAIVLIASTLDPVLMRDAMRAGVSEFITEPITQEELEKAIGRVVAERAAAKVGKVYGFVGAKGGVGATTVAVNVATALGAACKPARALLIDLHSGGGDTALFMGAEPRFSVVDALENAHRLDRVLFKNLVKQVAPHTDLLASPERASAGAFQRENIDQLIAFAASAYPYTVIDLSRSDYAILEALDRLSTIYIVANQELATVRSASRMAIALRERYGRDKVTVVLSRSDRQADIGVADVEKAVGSAIAYTFPSDYRVALHALNKGRPLALDNHNGLSASFKEFAERLAGVKSGGEAARSSGLFGRLTRS